MQARLLFPDPLLDELEENWWNQNAETVEAIWAQPELVRQGMREHYIKRAKKFFSRGTKLAIPIRVLEIGCGSGWVGRMLASPNQVEIIGIDISAKQIEIATKNAEALGLEETCKYTCENLADFIVNNDVDCVLIHAILHHLSWKEIQGVLEQLSHLKTGTKIFIYEPMYLANKPVSNLWDKFLIRMAHRLISMPNQLSKPAFEEASTSFDKDLQQKAKELFEQAHDNHWVLSPKEVVFKESDFLDKIGIFFNVKNRYLCNFVSTSLGYEASLYKDENLHERLNKVAFPAARWIDSFLFSTKIINLFNSNYVFMGYECTVK